MAQEETSGIEATDARAWLTREISRMKQDIADLERFATWQDRLIRAAESNPAEALRQRRPLEEWQTGIRTPV